MQFGGGFVKQENTAREHNHVLAGNGEAADLEQRLGQRDDVRHKSKHNDADDDCQPQPDNPCAVAPCGLDLVCQNRHKDKIVYPQYNFQHQKRGKTYPGMRFCQPTEIHDFRIPQVQTRKGSLKRSSCLNRRYAQKTAGGLAALLGVLHVRVPSVEII